MEFLKSTSAFWIVLSLAFIITTCTNTTTGPDKNEGEDALPQPYSQTIQVGHSANDFLADSNFTSLTIEIDYMEGYPPTQQALDSLQLFLEQRLNKSQITINEPTEIPSGGKQAYTITDVRNLEEEHRDLYTEFSDEDTLTTYMIILDGEYQSGSVLGVAYFNTSTALFGETIDNYSGGVTQPSQWKLESTVMRHEFGHLFGLVNIDGSGTDMQNPHQDSQNGHHCDNDQCLMYWAVETTDFIDNLIGENIPPLDQNCILDLQGNGGK